MVKITINAFKEAVKDSRGVISKIAEKLSVSRKAVYDFIKKFPDLQQVIDDEKEVFIDEVESQLFDKAKIGESWAIKYFLEVHAKSRGYKSEAKESKPEENDFWAELKKNREIMKTLSPEALKLITDS